MSNPFDQFDQQAVAQSGNEFDKFDAAAPVRPGAATMQAYEPSLFDELKAAAGTLVGAYGDDRPLIARVQESGGRVADALIPDSLQRGWTAGRRDLAQTVLPEGAGREAVSADLARQGQRFSASPEIEQAKRAMSEAQTVGEWFDATTGGALIDVIGESAGRQGVPLLASAVSPWVGVPMMGASSLNTERLGAVDEALGEAGVDLSDPIAVAMARVAMEKELAEAEKKGLTRGAVIAPIDMATMGLAGRFFRGTGLSQAAGRTLADLGLGSGGGATGEALAQIATEGRVNRLGDVLTEAAAEGPGGVVEGITNVYGAASRPQAEVAPEVAPPVAAVPAPAPTEQTLADAVAPRAAPMPPVAAAVAPAAPVPATEAPADPASVQAAPQAEAQPAPATPPAPASPESTEAPVAAPPAAAQPEQPVATPQIAWNEDGEGVSNIRTPDGTLMGQVLTEDAPDAVQIRGVEISPEFRGQGAGVAIYEQLADRALADGKVLRSDPTEISEDATRIYPALERRGYTVERGRSEAGVPTFTVTAGPTPDAAANPTPPSVPASTTAAAETVAPTGVKNAVTDAERVAEGRPERETGAPKTNESSVDEARQEIERNPSLGREVVDRLKNAGVQGITTRDEAVLMAHKVRVRNERDAAAKRSMDESLSEDERNSARRVYDELESEVAAIDEAAYNAGSEWGRFGQLRQRLIAADFSLEAMERKARMVKGAPLTQNESAEIRKLHNEIAAVQEKLDSVQRELEEAKAGTPARVTYEQVVRDLATELSARRQKSSRRPSVEALRKKAEESKRELRKMMGGAQFNSGIDPTVFYHLARIGAYHIANGATKLADFIAKVKADLGAKLFREVEPSLEQLHKTLMEAQGDPEKATAVTPESVLGAIDPENLRSADVVALARAHILAGVKGEGPVMKAVHADLEKIIPDITEREVRVIFSDYGKATMPSQEADRKELREIRRLVQLQESIDRLHEGLAPLKSGKQRDKATENIRKKQAQLNELLRAQEVKYKDSPEKLASYQATRKAALEQQIDRLKKIIEGSEQRPDKKKRPLESPEVAQLRAERDALRREVEAMDKVKKSPEQIWQERKRNHLQGMIAKLEDRIARGDYSRSVKPEQPKLNAENESLQFELYKKKREFLKRQVEIEMANRHPVKKIFGAVTETFNLARAIITSLDLSGLLRQGGFISFGHPIRAAKAVPAMLRAFASEESAYKSNRAIWQRDNANLYRKYKLEITDPDSVSLTKMEEEFMSRWLEKMPVLSGGGLVRGSARAYSTVLNILRADTFDALNATLVRGKEPTQAEGEAIANYVNAATGRGSLGKFQQSATLLNTVFFAPRWVLSRFQMLAAQPLWYGTGRTRALIAKEYARFIIGALVAQSLAFIAAGGDDDDELFISTDPHHTDFMRSKVGNVVIDPWAGFIPQAVLATRLVTGEKITGSGKVVSLNDPKYGQEDRFGLAARYLRTKLAPIPGAAVTIATGRNVVGQEQTPAETVLGTVTPLTLQDIIPVMEEAGIPRGTAMALMVILGMGVQHREPRDTGGRGTGRGETGRKGSDERGTGRE